MATEVSGLVEHLFRREAGKLISGLVRRLGAEHIDLAEESVQDALVRALKVWPYQGVPPNPAGWLTTTAQNLVVDKLRRRSIETRVYETVADTTTLANEDGHESGLDDQLAMMFAGCHPSVGADAHRIDAQSRVRFHN